MAELLIIDDDKIMVSTIVERLEDELPALKHQTVNKGSDGLRKLNETGFDVVILDMMLPLGSDLSLPTEQPDLMYGIFILRKIREKFPKLPVICYTVVTDATTQKQISEISNSKYLCKLSHNNFDELIAELQQICRNK